MPIRINGPTRLYAIVGDPIAQVRSPELYSERFAAMDLDAVMVPMRIPAAEFATVFPALLRIGNLDGVLVTYPFKAQAVAYAQRVGPAGRAVGAVNALRREDDGTWTADMFDGVGFVRGAERKGLRVSGRRVALFGAGGAGSAIAYALADGGAASVDVIDPDASKAAALAQRLAPLFPGRTFAVAQAVTEGIEMVVNASPVGMRDGDGLPGAVPSLALDAIVGDVVIRDAPTPLLQLAFDRGLGWVAGRNMLEGQVEALLDFLVPAH
ncbi:MAG: shikimate dehydrogenase [Proteobacteria bacterium]|nr:shikimate dehydrogenase [Pseudomonadota bacterium]